jgi:hypothetical protein
LLIALVFPLVAVFYLEAGVVIHGVVRHTSGNDSIFDGLYHYPLGNGYRLAFFNESAPEGGWIDAPPGHSLSLNRTYGLQVAGDFTFIDADRIEQPGTVPTVIVTHGEVPPADTSPPHVYLELNTNTHEQSDYPSLEELQRAAARRGIQLRLVPLDDFYDEAFSAATPGWLFLGVISAPVLIAAVGLLFRLHKLRRREPS